MGAEQLDFTGGGMLTNPEAIEAMISRMCHFVAAKDAEIAKLRAEADSEKQRASDWSAAAVTQRKRAEDAEAALAAARAALDGERGRADSYRESHKPTSGCVDRIYAGGVLGPIQIDNRCGLCKAHDKLRAAEAKEPK